MEADRLRPGRLPEDVVLEDAHAAVPGELRCETACSLGEHLRGDHVVRLPGVAELARAVLGVAAGNPVHLVGPDPGLVLAFEEREVALPEQLEALLRDEALLDDQEAVVLERLRPDRGVKRLDEPYADRHPSRLLPEGLRGEVREDAWPDAAEDVAAFVRNHLDPARRGARCHHVASACPPSRAP